MKYVKYGALVIITFVMIAGIAIPLSPSPQGWLEFPLIPGLEDKARNIFFHVPTAWTTVVAFLVSTYYGIRYLRTKKIDYDLISVSSAGLGLLFCILATVTGAFWAKFNWGSYWNWDPRQTSIFILLLIYGAYFALRSAIDVEEKRAALSTVYTIVAGLTVLLAIMFYATNRSVDLSAWMESWSSDRGATVAPAADPITEEEYQAAVRSILASESGAETTYDALVLLRVPGSMQPFHIDLIIAYGKLASGNAPDGEARFAALVAQYPWLSL